MAYELKDAVKGETRRECIDETNGRCNSAEEILTTMQRIHVGRCRRDKDVALYYLYTDTRSI